MRDPDAVSAPPPSHDLDEVAPIPILPGPGEQLRAAREAAGMSVHEISTHMRLDSRIVLALESDDYEQLPAPTFVRGYLRGYARLLDIPSEPIVQAFERRDFAPPSLVADISVRSQMQSGDFPFRIVTYVVVAALIVLVVLWWKSQDFAPVSFDVMPGSDPQVSETDSALPIDDAIEPESLSPTGEPDAPEPEGTEPESITPPDDAPASEPEDVTPSDVAALSEAETGASADEEQPFALEGETGEASPPMPQPESAGVEPEPIELGEDATEPAEAADEAATVAPEEEATATETAEGPALDEPADEEPEAQTGVAAEPEAIAEEDAGVAPAEALEDQTLQALETGEEIPSGTDAPAARLELSFTLECWLEVYDHADEQLFYGLAQPGDQLDLSGRGPIRMVLGNSEGVEVRYNGTPVDFSAFTARGVARFSVGGEPPTAFQTPAAPESAGEPESTGN